MLFNHSFIYHFEKFYLHIIHYYTKFKLAYKNLLLLDEKMLYKAIKNYFKREGLIYRMLALKTCKKFKILPLLFL